MKKLLLIVVCCICGTILYGETEAEQLLRLSERVIFPAVYYSRMSMTTSKPGSPDRTIVMESWYKEGAGTLMEMTAPVRSKGIRMLQTGGTLWLYNPRSGGRQAVRLSPENSFQGSLFSNEDVGDSQYTDDYSPSITGQEIINVTGLGEVECTVLEAKALHREAPYGMLKFWVSAEGMPYQIEYYAKSGLLLKVMHLSEVKTLGGRQRPSKMEMISMEQEGFKTVVIIQELEDLDDLPASKFTRNALFR